MLNVAIESFSYSDREILKDISFQLNKGEHLAVLGESGCGKSTLLHIIYGLLHLEKGVLSWNETPLLGPKHHLIPGEAFIKLVAQEFNIMPFSTV
ncbi:MAG: ATP-binding cassette domain-containing protein, partial [Altibacter sp.]|nr:ATP-binding cassette domain-containing protein [Altibacter sp.]